MLLSAAGNLVAEGNAFAELPVETIARRAGVSRQTFYAYFADKPALARAIGEMLSDEVAGAGGPWLSQGSGDLRQTLAAVFSALEANRGAVLALVEAAGYDDEIGSFWRELHGRFMGPAVARWRGMGADQATAEARAFTLVWATERAMVEQLTAPRVGTEQLLDALELLWRAADPPE